MHMQVHRPRSVACPICGDRRFRTGANAVQHVESGSCSGCQGRDNARRQIYNFARQQQSMQGFMNGLMGGIIMEFPTICISALNVTNHSVS